MAASIYRTKGRRANKPYYLNRICVRIYSAEELAFLICENPELLEKDIFTVELANWLEEECCVSYFAEKLYRLISTGAELEAFVSFILNEFEFVEEREKERIVQIVRSGAKTDMVERRKLRGDFFLEKERYGHAIREYIGLLECIPKDQPQFLAEVYHNIGIAQARLFLFDLAKENFIRAYELDCNKEHYLAYAACLRFMLSDKEYIQAASEDIIMSEVTMELEEKMQQALQDFTESRFAKEACQKRADGQVTDNKVFEDWVKEQLIELKEDYHRYVV